MKDANVNTHKNEQGFVLVIAIILLSILALFAMTAMTQSMIGIKISRMASNSDVAMNAAKSGSNQTYWYWSQDAAGKTEFSDLIKYIGAGGAVVKPAIYQGALTPTTINDAPTIAEIQNNTGVRVYTMTANGLVLEPNNSVWGTTKDAQVAVWATTFNDSNAPDYPYTQPVNLEAGGVCAQGCRMVVYTLGIKGEARRLIRETHSVVESRLIGMGALVNATEGDDFTELCNAGTGGKTGYANGINFDYTTVSFGGNGSVVIEATQADYDLASLPSGTAMTSNTAFGIGAKGFSAGTASQTGVTFLSPPYIMYSGHDTSSAFNINWMDEVMDTTNAILPAGKNPQGLVGDALFATGNNVQVFVDSSTQLFSMDHYRWGAEQFTCQDPTKADNFDGNGKFCSRGERLRQALLAQGYPAYAPVTGRITVAAFEYNIAHAIPMFGIVRVMLPLAPTASTATCSIGNIELHTLEDATMNSGGWNLTNLSASGTYNGMMKNPATNGGKYAFRPTDGAVPDTDGALGVNARLIVYGSLLVDYFADYPEATGGAFNAAIADTVFAPFQGEQLLSQLESPDALMAMQLPIMINPAMPRFTGVIPKAFPTAALGGQIAMADATGGVTINVNLASPTAGYFPWSEGLLPPTGEGNAGTMRLMSRAIPADNAGGLGLNQMVAAIGVDNQVAGTTTEMTDMLALTNPKGGTEADIIHYYYDLMAATSDKSDANTYPVAPWPFDNFSAPFCQGVDDCKPKLAGWQNHMGDKVHLLFPSGYMHGWKVALAALDMTALEWSYLLSDSALPAARGIGDTGGLFDQVANICSSDPFTPGTSCKMGAPFAIGVDAAALDKPTVANIQREETLYFYVQPDPVTGYGLLNAKWQDIPAMLYSGGLLEMQAHTNISGVTYTPGPLEWEGGNAPYDTGVAMGYVNGSIITGYGAYIKNVKADDRYILVYDPNAVDNVHTNRTVVILRQYDWQSLD